MRFVALVLFALLAVTHLYGCSCALETLRRRTKPFLMPVLCVVYLCFAQERSPWVVAGLLLGSVGDFLLLYQRKTRFLLGGMAAFALGHGCYIAAMAGRFGFARPGAGWVLLVGLLYAAAFGAVFWGVYKKLPRALLAPGMGYMLVLYVLSALALFCLLKRCTPATAALYAGTLFFLASDTVLLFEYCRRHHGGSFPVMWTYLCAQTLIVAAFII